MQVTLTKCRTIRDALGNITAQGIGLHVATTSSHGDLYEQDFTYDLAHHEFGDDISAIIKRETDIAIIAATQACTVPVIADDKAAYTVAIDSKTGVATVMTNTAALGVAVIG